MKISKFINTKPKEDIFHSSGIAKAAGGGTLGSTSAESFGNRSQINRGRQTVRGYGESMIGQGHMRQIARPTLDASNPLRRSVPRTAGRQQHNAMGGSAPIVPPRTFKEPPGRGFNPYG